TSLLPIFEIPVNSGNTYGARVRGYICPPTTGNYSFWIASDDKGELWLSTDDNPAIMYRAGLHQDCGRSTQNNNLTRSTWKRGAVIMWRLWSKKILGETIWPWAGLCPMEVFSVRLRGPICLLGTLTVVVKDWIKR
ncbi:MAG: PA14 domain-containing protein, partial [Bacteroidota bacterium]